jgi:DMSO/TMAO reductase YedYZ molybdopterin-dependent catalytic subunit/thiosulfate reductase cytochrome b subunit
MSERRLIYRHRFWVRLTHWLNLVCMTVLLMSGLQIFNAHPALYWGERSRFDEPLLLIAAERGAQGQPMGVTEIAGRKLDTTGLLGLSGDPTDRDARAFPAWATLPSGQWLALGRRWHFFFAWIFVANGAAYAAAALRGGHFARDLLPSAADLRHVGVSIRDHLRLRFPEGDAARQYNVVQKLTYLLVLFVLAPLLVGAGLAMSPRLDAGWPWLLHLFGGRQSARTIHFVCAFAFLGFAFIHIAMVLVSGVRNNLRSMITGWYDSEGAMVTDFHLGRRRFLARASGSVAALSLGGCDRISTAGWFTRALEGAERITSGVQRIVTSAHALAPEYGEADLSPDFRSNGTQNPDDDGYQALAGNAFADWRLEVGGRVERPRHFSLAELRALPPRTQITRHDCVEGWSCIAKWKGVRLSALLDAVGPQQEARYVMFFCADPMKQTLDGSDSRYYESIDIEGAYHAQTILADDMNDSPLPIRHGAPLRLRDERQLGYKMAKYIMRIELVDSFAPIRGGRGGYWEDRGYEWYAGI